MTAGLCAQTLHSVPSPWLGVCDLRRNGSFLPMELRLQRAAGCARIGGAVNHTPVLRLHHRRLIFNPRCTTARTTDLVTMVFQRVPRLPQRYE